MTLLTLSLSLLTIDLVPLAGDTTHDNIKTNEFAVTDNLRTASSVPRRVENHAP